jgi:hypothetical protein
MPRSYAVFWSLREAEMIFVPTWLLVAARDEAMRETRAAVHHPSPISKEIRVVGKCMGYTTMDRCMVAC